MEPGFFHHAFAQFRIVTEQKRPLQRFQASGTVAERNGQHFPFVAARFSKNRDGDPIHSLLNNLKRQSLVLFRARRSQNGS